MSSIIETIKENTAFRTVVSAVKVTYGYVSERMWAVYSVGVVTSAICMIAAAQEKQTLADHLYGSNLKFRENAGEAASETAKLMKDEVSLAVKQAVWSLPANEFRNEYRERHGDSPVGGRGRR
jgi:hypothetical protein